MYSFYGAFDHRESSTGRKRNHSRSASFLFLPRSFRRVVFFRQTDNFSISSALLDSSAYLVGSLLTPDPRPRGWRPCILQQSIVDVWSLLLALDPWFVSLLESATLQAPYVIAGRTETASTCPFFRYSGSQSACSDLDQCRCLRWYLPPYLRKVASVGVQITCMLSKTCCSCLIILGYLGEEIWRGRSLIDHET